LTIRIGLQASSDHDQNGMTEIDMAAASAAANELKEIIIFRSTGPWSKRWLEDGYPSKNFHVKGKSSDWGPHAGLVPHNGIYSKVGYDPVKAAKGTEANNDGISSGFAGKQPLVLTYQQIQRQRILPAGKPARTALQEMITIDGSEDLFLFAARSGDDAVVSFRAVHQGGGRYEIRVYPAVTGQFASNRLRMLDDEKKGKLKTLPLEVMTSNEVGAGKPMTGDYDLFCVCPSWRDYNTEAGAAISKPGIALANSQVKEGLAFERGARMDKVLDPRLSTMGAARPNAQQAGRPLHGADHKDRQKLYEQRQAGGKQFSPDSAALIADKSKYIEHNDMGNLTPRILRCINALNAKMGAVGTKAAIRRVHHNAESHRFRAFGALSELDMNTRKDGELYGDGFPLTVFQPSCLTTGGLPTARFTSVCTLESLAEFKEYVQAVTAAGYYVPKNWIWNVPSSVDTTRAALQSQLVFRRAT